MEISQGKKLFTSENHTKHKLGGIYINIVNMTMSQFITHLPNIINYNFEHH
jgi:hypothetical protein